MKTLSSECRVTAGIVAFNTPLGTLKATLTSLRLSTVRVKIIVLCNSPISAYQNDVSSLCSEFETTCISNAPNHGFGAGHNQIWKSSDSEWYICCNPDIIAEPTAIERLIEFGEANQCACLLMPKVLNTDGTVQAIARQHPTPLRWIKRQLWRMAPSMFTPFEVRFDYSQTQPVEFVSGCFFASRVSLLEKIDGFDESFFLYAEDADLSFRANQLGKNWFVCSAVVVHNWAAEWKKNRIALLRGALGIARYWLKHALAFNRCIK